MTVLKYECGCEIDFDDYGETIADLCNYHSDILRAEAKADKEKRLRDFYRLHPEGNHLDGWTYSGSDPETIKACQEERAKYSTP